MVFHQFFYKKVSDFITEPLRLIFERSYEDGVVPNFFRQSIVTPVHKKGPKDCLDNYRPVAQSSIACIIFEKILIDHINEFVSVNGIGDVSQHGFTKGLSTETQLIQIVHDWSLKLNKNEQFSCIYFDFSKAFDRVNHSLLLHKLNNLGIHKKTTDWIGSYLTNRSFQVRMNETLSGASPCSSGVPQGSCLGPILFKLFLLDLPREIPSGIAHKLFADDLKIYNVFSTCDLMLLEQTIDSIAKWCALNDMVISVPKCAVLSSFGQPCNLYLTGSLIPVVKVYKDLGVLMTPSLDFSDHISHVVKNASRVCSLIFRSFVIKRPQFYIRLYKSLVEPILTYCSTVWSPHKAKDVIALESIRSRFIKRLSRRCNIAKKSILLKSVMELHREMDIRMYHRLQCLGIAEHLFEVEINNLRSVNTIRSLQVARTEKINNTYSFRLPRIIR